MNLSHAAHLAQLAYNDPPDIECRRTDTQVIVRDGEIAFRGTTSLRDWVINLQTSFAALREGVVVHEGFSIGWCSVADRVREAATGPVLRVYGHSLGGALATCAAADLAPLYEHVELITFGSPRVLHYSCRLPDNVTHVRCANNCDAVPRVPFRSMGYTHRGRVLYWDHDGQARDIDGWRLWLDRAWGRLDDIGRPGAAGTNDHDMHEYLRLAQAYDRAEAA